MSAGENGTQEERPWRFRTSPPVRARKLVICLSIRARAWKKESVYGVFNGSEREEIWPPVGRRENFGFQRVFAEMCIGSQRARGTAMFAEPLPRIISGSRGLVYPQAGGLREGSSSICRLRVNRTSNSSPSGEYAAGDIISLLWVRCTETRRPPRAINQIVIIDNFVCCSTTLRGLTLTLRVSLLTMLSPVLFILKHYL